MLRNVPTGVMIDRKGKIKVLFSLVDISHVLDIADAERYTAQCKTMEGLPDPQPPAMVEATTTSIELQWLSRLPFPVGIVQAVEVQYAVIGKEDLLAQPAGSYQETKQQPPSPSKKSGSSEKYRWFSLVSRTYNQTMMGQYSWTNLPPGSQFVVRMRYRTAGVNWSEYSVPSHIYATIADRPRPPPPPNCVAITSFAIQINWDLSVNAAGEKEPAAVAARRASLADNGSPVFEYVLVGKSVGGEEFVELYRGPNKTHLLLGLYAEFAYSFKLAAVNSMGMSDFSPLVSIQTPARPTRNSSVAKSIAVATAAGINVFNVDFHRCISVTESDANSAVIAYSGYTEAQIQIARQCRDAWREYWDASTEQPFYFNSILSIRQLEMPAILRVERGERDAHAPNQIQIGASARGSGTNSTGVSPQRRTSQSTVSALDPTSPEILFRKKRYRLLHALRKKPAGSGTAGSTSRDIIHLELHRESMLSDCYRAFEKLSSSDFKRRVKVSFIGERGLDSGGLSKEAFLLLTKQAAYYAGPKYHKWLCGVISTVKVRKSTETNQSLLNKATLPSSRAAAEDNKSNNNYEAEEQVEGYFLNTVNESKPAIVLSDNADPSKDAQLDACYKSIIELDTHLKVSGTQYFKFLGRLLGKAVFDRQLVDFPMSTLLCKHLLGEFTESVQPSVGASFSAPTNSNADYSAKPQSAKDKDSADNKTLQMLHELKHLDQELHKSLQWMWDNDVTNIIYETFSVSDGTSEFPLCANGEKTDVTEENKREYVKLMISWKTTYSVAKYLFPFVQAFHEIVPLTALKSADLTPDELNLMLNGKREVEVEELRAYCIYQGADAYFNDTHEGVVWFWQAVRSFNQTERRNLLKFFTGSARVPLDGFDPPINITQGEDMVLNSLPRSHTCFNQLVLPRYANYEMCVKQLKFAMENTVGFELV